MDLILLTLALFATAYAAQAGLSWLRRAVAEIPSRRKAMALNLLRRAGPPVVGGVILWLGGTVMGLSNHLSVVAVLIAGSLAYGFHTGLRDIRMNNWRAVALRVAIATAITLLILWQTGLA